LKTLPGSTTHTTINSYYLYAMTFSGITRNFKKNVKDPAIYILVQPSESGNLASTRLIYFGHS
jgi:hypothetical protein